VSIGKAGWEMAKTAYDILGDKIDSGIVITKYDHSKGAIGKLEIYEAGHPVVDFNGISATKRAIELTSGLTEKDTVLFLVSGGGSALFESVSYSFFLCFCQQNSLLLS
jgi:hydroxypyruvate reductase